MFEMFPNTDEEAWSSDSAKSPSGSENDMKKLCKEKIAESQREGGGRFCSRGVDGRCVPDTGSSKTGVAAAARPPMP